MSTILNKLFIASPLEQFDSVFAGKFSRLRTISEELGSHELQNFDIFNVYYHYYDEYLSQYSTGILTLSALIFYLVAGIISRLLNVPFGVFKYRFELPVHYIIYFFLKALYYFSIFVSFTLIATPITLKDMFEVVYYIYLIKVSQFVYIDLLIYTTLVYAWMYFFYKRADYYDLIGTSIMPANNYHYFLEGFHKYSIDMLGSITNKEKRTQQFYPITYVMFFFILISNVQGLIPYCYTITSHLVDTFYFALGLFSYIIYIIISEQGVKFFLSLFLPSGTPLALSFLLVPIEIVSYFFRVVSLSVRLFANMMAGHTLLKVILGFSWTILTAGEAYFVINFIPIIILMLLTTLELGVAVIQSYIFSILTCIYLKDAYEGH